MKHTPNFGSLHELLTHQFNPDKLYQFILFPTETQHTFSHKDNRGKDVPLTKGVFPLNFPYRLEHKTVMLLDKDGRQVIYKDESEKKALIKAGAKMSPVIVRDCLGEMEILMHLQTSEKDKKHIVTTKLFTDGRITLRGTEINELKVLISDDAFANKIDRDQKKKALFFLRDEEAYEVQQIEKEDKIFKIEKYVRDLANIDAVRAYARTILPAAEYDKLSGNDLSIIRRVAALAKQNPDVFDTAFKNPAKFLKLHYIKEAIESDIVTYNERANSLSFQKTGALILQCPFGIDVQRQFADNAMSESNMAAVNNYAEMMKLLRPDSNKKEAVKMDVKSDEGQESAESQTTNTGKYDKKYTSELMNKGVDLGCIEIINASSGAFHWMKKGDANYRHFKGSKKFSEALETDKEFETEVLTKLGIPQ